jgi:WD40 repeat protein
MWEVATGRMIAQLNGYEKQVNDAAFSADGRWVVTVSDDGTARVWSVRWLTQYHWHALVDAVCKEKLLGANRLNADDDAVSSLRGRQGVNVYGS